MIIETFKNNNKTLYFEFKQGEDDYNLPVGVVVKFTVKKSTSDSDSEIIFSKEIVGTGESEYSVNLSCSDTNLPVGVYFWDLKDTTNGVTIVGPDKFVVKEVVLINE